MPRYRIALLLLLIAIAFPLRAADTDDANSPPPYDWSQFDPIFKLHGEFKDDVFTITIPRTDLNVTVEGMDVPAAAGIASVFHFYRCPCGKIRVVGQFCCADFETNDVIDAIRAGNAITVASVGPMFVGDKPRMTILHFQGEGDGVALAKLLKSGLDWTGPARSATQPIR
jgi:hypothetical protein